jgi:membrane-associated phospholipid phosphatase
MKTKFVRSEAKNLGLVLFTALFLILSYVYFDRPIAYQMAEINLNAFFLFHIFNPIAIVIDVGAILTIIILGIKGCLKVLTQQESRLFLMSVTIGIAVYIKSFLKILFGRFWPQTWYLDNPSLLQNQVYGFDFLHLDFPYGAFPSGHATVVFCAMTFVWLLAPKWRWLALLVCLLQASALIVLNYHFLSDVIGGAVLGILCSLASVRMRLFKENHA